MREVRVEGADELGVRHVVRPVDVQRVRGAVEAAHRTVRGRGEGAQDAGAVGEHQVGGGHAGEQGDLGVPAVGGERGAVAEFVGVVALDDLLLGHVEGDAAALDLQPLARLADVLEQRERFLGGAGVDPPLHGRVVELGPAADQRPADVDGDRTAVRVQVERPQHRGPRHVRQQTRGALAQQRRVQRGLLVREVEGGDPPVGLRVQRPARGHEGGDVRDGVPDPETAPPTGQVHRLVQVHRRGRVDGEEGDVGRVLGGKAAGPSRRPPPPRAPPAGSSRARPVRYGAR